MAAARGEIELHYPAVFRSVSSNEQVLLDESGHGLRCSSLGCAARLRECADRAGALVCAGKVAKRFPLGRVQPFREAAAVAAPRSAGEEFCNGACSHDDPLMAPAYDGGGTSVNAS